MNRLTLTRRQTVLAGVGVAATAACAVNTQAAGDPLKYKVPQPGWLWQKRKLDAHTDYSERFSRRDKVIIYGADDIRTADVTEVKGAHTVVFMGGHYKPKKKKQDAVIRIADVRNQIHAEGLVIEPAYAQDAFQFWGEDGTRPTCTFQACWMAGLDGMKSTRHPDLFQPLGPIGRFRCYECYGQSGYQGIFMSIQPEKSGADILGIEIEKTDLEHLSSNPRVGNEYSYLIWLDHFPERGFIRDTFVTQKNGQRAEEHSVWPKVGMDGGAEREGDLIRWPESLNVEGEVTVGKRPGGPALDRESVGIVNGRAYQNVRGYGA